MKYSYNQAQLNIGGLQYWILRNVMSDVSENGQDQNNFYEHDFFLNIPQYGVPFEKDAELEKCLKLFTEAN